MSNNSKAKYASNMIKPWLSANGDNKEKVFTQVGASLLESIQFNKLSVSARYLYICMCLVAKNGREFQFPNRYFKKYGMSESRARRDIKALINGGFVTLKSSGKNTRQPNIYEFSYDWKNK